MLCKVVKHRHKTPNCHTFKMLLTKPNRCKKCYFAIFKNFPLMYSITCLSCKKFFQIRNQNFNLEFIKSVSSNFFKKICIALPNLVNYFPKFQSGTAMAYVHIFIKFQKTLFHKNTDIM